MRVAQPLLVAAVVSLLALSATADGRTRAECERDYKPQVGQAGKDVVWVPTPDELVNRMLTMAKVTPKDYVFDLGAGDGKIAIAAGKKFGATAVGIEYNPDMAKLAQCFVQAEGVTDRVKIIQGDIFKEDFSKATVVTMYLLPELNMRLRPTILAMKPGTRSPRTSSTWATGGRRDRRDRVPHRLPVDRAGQVEGSWTFRDDGGKTTFNVAMTQKFQRLSGDASMGSNKNPLVGATLRGEEIKFAFNDDKGQTRTLTGTVRGNEIIGTLRGPAARRSRSAASAASRRARAASPADGGAFSYPTRTPAMTSTTTSQSTAADSAPRPALSVFDAVMIITGIVIGGGIFSMPPLVAGVTGSVQWMLVAWLAGGVLSLIGALVYAELATTYPSAGGDYHFLTRAYGRDLSFFFAWARVMVITTGSIAMLAFIFGDYMSRVLSLGAHSSTIYAVLTVVLLTAVNIIGLRESARTQNVLTLLLIAGLALVAVAGAIAYLGGRAPTPADGPPAGGLPAAFGLAMVFVLLTFGGWNEAAYISAEVKGAAAPS